ncbi:MAG: polyprenyl synthetase family protein [Lachnospiraceae bacterium]|nr:polyprenyl synthetase family protein [Lachnospiraceae bacterium]
MRVSTSKPEKTVLKTITNDILREDLVQFEQKLQAQLSRQSEYLTDNEYEMYRRGKKLRPILALLFSRMVCGNEELLPEKCYKAAASLEMLHVASLIHDDIIDNSDYRRSLPTVHNNRGIGSAIILGDMQFLQAVRGFVDVIQVQDDMELVQMVLDVAFDVSRGEMDEILAPKAEDYEKMRQRYLKTIERKTATLMGLACEAGVILGGGKRSDSRRAGNFGRRVGLAFQIMDDVTDFIRSKNEAGKTGQTDLRNRTLSLPIILALESAENTCLTDYMNNENAELTADVFNYVMVNGLCKAYEYARAYAQEAQEYLSFFPRNRYSECLKELLSEMVDKV